uniref:Uncharacterized protein n=1 Tax=Globisporangium ultimum (strain ATCC 200006 / CBS 805.95 / DAOM BR144) TaxID=431595 RepID=K3WM44_GLOUD
MSSGWEQLNRMPLSDTDALDFVKRRSSSTASSTHSPLRNLPRLFNVNDTITGFWKSCTASSAIFASATDESVSARYTSTYGSSALPMTVYMCTPSLYSITRSAR